MKITNNKAYQYVQDRREFKGANIFAGTYNEMYAVFSYGVHWPLFIYDGKQWYENADKYSVTTSKHHGQCHPRTDTVKLPCDAMRKMLNL